ncbi:hypothetical protein FBU59_002012 [Linderina macrospora]|uniref:Uncharacterized protein n=1 Tax=Linderina macrospora TaxID=4868 RepID=A0ACC1JCK7_9FUNG|nr:hypothetical protein FBU59_002012 [Linderina macrospora]
MVLPTIRELETIRISLGTGAASATVEAPAATTTPAAASSQPTVTAHGHLSDPVTEQAQLGRSGLGQQPEQVSGSREALSTISGDSRAPSHPLHNGSTAVQPSDEDAGPTRSASAESADDDRGKTVGILTKYKGELRDVTDKCNVLAQFASQYGPERNKFNAQPSDDLVIDMARKAYEVLMVFMTIRRERMSTSVDDDTMEYIRKRRTVLSPARSKTRKRSM